MTYAAGTSVSVEKSKAALDALLPTGRNECQRPEQAITFQDLQEARRA